MTHPIKPVSATGTQRLYRFHNDLGASVISDGYGQKDGLLELAVIRWNGKQWERVTDTPITNDVIGWLDEGDVQELLELIQDLPIEGETA